MVDVLDASPASAPRRVTPKVCEAGTIWVTSTPSGKLIRRESAAAGRCENPIHGAAVTVACEMMHPSQQGMSAMFATI